MANDITIESMAGMQQAFLVEDFLSSLTVSFSSIKDNNLSNFQFFQGIAVNGPSIASIKGTRFTNNQRLEHAVYVAGEALVDLEDIRMVGNSGTVDVPGTLSSLVFATDSGSQAVLIRTSFDDNTDYIVSVTCGSAEPQFSIF